VGDPGHFTVVRRRNKYQADETLADVLCNCCMKHNFANALRSNYIKLGTHYDFAIRRLSMQTLLTQLDTERFVVVHWRSTLSLCRKMAPTHNAEIKNAVKFVRLRPSRATQ